MFKKRIVFLHLLFHMKDIFIEISQHVSKLHFLGVVANNLLTLCMRSVVYYWTKIESDFNSTPLHKPFRKFMATKRTPSVEYGDNSVLLIVGLYNIGLPPPAAAAGEETRFFCDQIRLAGDNHEPQSRRLIFINKWSRAAFDWTKWAHAARRSRLSLSLGWLSIGRLNME